MDTLKTDVLIAGAGSGGIGAAVGAAEKGCSVLLIDPHHLPGGCVTHAWVHNWEPTCGSGPLAHRLWERMRKMDLGAADMEFTNSRLLPDGNRAPTMPFELWAYLRAVQDEFREKNVRFIGGVRLLKADVKDRRIVSVLCGNDFLSFRVEAKSFIDATDPLVLASESGCERMLGEDAKAEFGEPDAPEIPKRNRLNGVNWIYRIRPNARAPKFPGEEVCSILARRNAFFSAEMPNGDMLINICGSGQFDPENREDYGKVLLDEYRVAQDSFYYFTRQFPDWQLIGIAPEMGIRESYRLRARNIMTERDVLSGGKRYAGRFVTETNHPLDIHGSDLCSKGSFRYGIDYLSLLPPSLDNLWIASRGIGVTHLAAGSSRLSRTVMTLGEAAGRAAGICAQRNGDSGDVKFDEIARFDHLEDA